MLHVFVVFLSLPVYQQARSFMVSVLSRKASESVLFLTRPMTIALLIALAGSLGLMAFIVRRLERS
jgi:hypothetical protein